ncbi:MAG: hypothetical protein ACK452_03065, partial [Bacteroidota bacterium]
DGDLSKLTLPDSDDFEIASRYLKENKKNKDIKRIISSDGRDCRITGKIQDLGSKLIENKNKNFQDFLNKKINLELLDIKLTGSAELLDSSNNYMVDNMLQGFYFSILIIGCLTWILHRSLKMV